ncbi:hypothetical protein FGO68_gene1195 [Halteria grandinella]|uniref:Uncharacterized protein n=1 Tax=Halteria grandinella TaxID=5974 RepID=A0A8J8NEL6_HALGN|nr:hypothetical protein FGO68_gene1195 [Halteria grandinella]
MDHDPNKVIQDMVYFTLHGYQDVKGTFTVRYGSKSCNILNINRFYSPLIIEDSTVQLISEIAHTSLS